MDYFKKYKNEISNEDINNFIKIYPKYKARQG